MNVDWHGYSQTGDPTCCGGNWSSVIVSLSESDREKNQRERDVGTAPDLGKPKVGTGSNKKENVFIARQGTYDLLCLDVNPA